MEHDELGRFGEGGGVNPDSAEVKAKEISRGRAALEKCLSEGVVVRDAVKRGDLGAISLVYGDERYYTASFSALLRNEGVDEILAINNVFAANTASTATRLNNFAGN